MSSRVHAELLATLKSEHEKNWTEESHLPKSSKMYLYDVALETFADSGPRAIFH